MDLLMSLNASRLNRIDRLLRVALLSSLVLLVTSQSAHAHLVTSGVGPFYDGMAHFFVTPEDLLVVVALSLFGGMSGKKVAKWVAVALPLAWLLGMLVGTHFSEASGVAPLIASITMLLSGLLLSASPQVSLRAMLPLVAVIGAVHGWLNGEAVASSGTSLLAGLGIVIAAAIVGLLLSATSVRLTASWQRVALRVAGSWIAAIGLLAVAWQFRTLTP
jgi:urease accessory protein